MTDDLLAIRAKTHGHWPYQSDFAQKLKDLMHQSPNFYEMRAGQREAMEMIAVKISRILCGDWAESDHWDDLAGYARLGSGEHDGTEPDDT